MEDLLAEREPVPVEPPNEPLPPRAQIEEAAINFFAEVNSIVYIMTFEGFQQCLESIYGPKGSCSNAAFGVVYTLASLFPGGDHAFSQASHYIRLAIEEGSIETVQALMLMVC